MGETVRARFAIGGCAIEGCAFGRQRLGGRVAVFDDVVARRFVPYAIFIDEREGANGGEDGGAGATDGFGVFGEVGDGIANVFVAKFVEAGGVGVAIDGAHIPDLVVDRDVDAAVPVKEIVFDVFAIGVGADFAFTRVAGEGAGLAARAGWLVCIESKVGVGIEFARCVDGIVFFCFESG